MNKLTDNPQNYKLNKDKKRLAQKKAVFSAFYKAPSTMKMVDVKTGVMRENICWYCRDFRNDKVLKAVKKGICPITKNRATFWTTNPDYFPKDNQLKLFKP
jgi:hypothetical protein